MSSSSLLKDLYANKAEFNKFSAEKLRVDGKVVNLKNNEIVYNTFNSKKSNKLHYLGENDSYHHYKIDIPDIEQEFNKICDSTVIDLLGPICNIKKTNMFFEELYEGFKKNGRDFDIDSIDIPDLPEKISNNELEEEKMNYNMDIQFFDNQGNKKMIYLTLLSVSKLGDNGYRLGLYFYKDSKYIHQNIEHDKHSSKKPHFHRTPIAMYDPNENATILIPTSHIIIEDYIMTVSLVFIIFNIIKNIGVSIVKNIIKHSITQTAENSIRDSNNNNNIGDDIVDGFRQTFNFSSSGETLSTFENLIL